MAIPVTKWWYNDGTGTGAGTTSSTSTTSIIDDYESWREEHKRLKSMGSPSPYGSAPTVGDLIPISPIHQELKDEIASLKETIELQQKAIDSLLKMQTVLFERLPKEEEEDDDFSSVLNNPDND